MAGIFDILPGYLKMPNPNDADLATFLKRTTPTASKPGVWDSFNYYSNTPKFAVSLLKAFYGDAATKQNDFAFNYLPKIDRNYSWTQIWDQMYRGNVKGMFAFGMNGVMIGPDTQKNIDALKKADWLVVGEIYPDETSEFWRAPGTTTDEMKKINTTVYRLPCAGFAEKDGTMVNSARWLQWKNAAVPPPGDCATRPGHPGANLSASSGALSERWRQIPRSALLHARGATPIRSIRRSRKWPRRSTAKRSRT